MFILINGMPFCYDGERAYPIQIDAFKVFILKDNPIPVKTTIGCVYTEDEMRMRLGIKKIDDWDEVNKKVVKKSNKTVSSVGVNPYIIQAQNMDGKDEQQSEDGQQPEDEPPSDPVEKKRRKRKE
jgi:hypothetical protein